MLTDGFATLITFAENGSVQLWEKEVTPPGYEGGGAVDQTTMRNTTWRTQLSRQLTTASAMTLTAAYDPAAYLEVLNMRKTNQQITVTFPDASTLVFFGWIEAFTPNTLTEGEQPTAELTLEVSNIDPADDSETGPVYASAATGA